MPSRQNRSEENAARPPVALKRLVISAVWQKEFAPLLNMQQGCGGGEGGGQGPLSSSHLIISMFC